MEQRVLIAKTCRMVIGSFIIQQRMGFSDRDLVKQIQKSPYYQYFIGLEFFLRRMTQFAFSLISSYHLYGQYVRKIYSLRII